MSPLSISTAPAIPDSTILVAMKKDLEFGVGARNNNIVYSKKKGAFAACGGVLGLLALALCLCTLIVAVGSREFSLTPPQVEVKFHDTDPFCVETSPMVERMETRKMLLALAVLRSVLSRISRSTL